MPVATCSHLSCEIGNGRDMLDHGEISHVNATASELGCRPGQDVRTCAELMRRAGPAAGTMPEMKESRVTLRDEPGAPRVVAIDSASLLSPHDEGAIVITGSHGALLGGKPDSVVSVKARAMVYCDAGLGKNEAGATRLPVLDSQGIAAVTAAADTARIGDARSIYEDGVISRANQIAQALGIGPGDSVREFVERAGRASDGDREG
jgi:uncharacterized protein YunC (DUF1805 family)